MLKKLAFAAVLSSLGVLSAQALPAAPVPSTVEISDVMPVAGGCGGGFYRDRYGVCRPKRGYRAAAPVLVVPGAVVVAPTVRSCPPGMWRNRHGRCVY